jgi:poly-gamma-glutamate capsule biosynthesis protein CapA/YwtB (metallophosphatase superfamily)
MKPFYTFLSATLLMAAAAHAIAAQPTPATPAPSDDLVVSAVGDIMLDASSRPIMDGMGYDYAYAEVRKFFAGSQIIFGNLEGPLTDRGTAETDKKFTFRSPPAKVSAALKNAGFNVVSLANNHMLDYGPDGLAQTIETLDTAGIRHAGAGADLLAARQPALLEAGGKKIAVLAYSITLPENFYAADHRPGTAFAREEEVRADIIAARKQADIVLVSFHWGQEGKTELRDYQKYIGHLAIDSGASAVIGSHPHILQGIEHYKDGVILYSMGNFTFGSYSSHSTRSAVAQLRFHDGRLTQVRMYPINVNNFEVAFQPKPLNGADADAVIANLAKLSAERHTEVRNDHGVGVVDIR